MTKIEGSRIFYPQWPSHNQGRCLVMSVDFTPISSSFFEISGSQSYRPVERVKGDKGSLTSPELMVDWVKVMRLSEGAAGRNDETKGINAFSQNNHD